MYMHQLSERHTKTMLMLNGVDTYLMTVLEIHFKANYFSYSELITDYYRTMLRNNFVTCKLLMALCFSAVNFNFDANRCR